MIEIVLRFVDDKDGMEAMEAMKHKKRVLSNHDTKWADCKYEVVEVDGKFIPTLIIEKKKLLNEYTDKRLSL